MHITRSLPIALALAACGGSTASTAPTSQPETAMQSETEPAQHGEHGDHGHHGVHGHHGPDGEHGNHEDRDPHHRHDHHFTDPERYVPAWNSPERDAWQKPEEIIAILGAEPGDTVVDLGAGTGYLLPPLSTAVGADGTVIAADIEPAMLAFIDEAAANEGWANVQTHHAPLDGLGLPPESVDGIVTLNVWHHIEGREAYAAGLLEVLRPGAAFVVVDFLNEETEGFGPPMAMRLSAEQVVAELTAGGLEAEIVEETMPRHYVVRGVRPATP